MVLCSPVPVKPTLRRASHWRYDCDEDISHLQSVVCVIEGFFIPTLAQEWPGTIPPPPRPRHINDLIKASSESSSHGTSTQASYWVRFVLGFNTNL